MNFSALSSVSFRQNLPWNLPAEARRLQVLAVGSELEPLLGQTVLVSEVCVPWAKLKTSSYFQHFFKRPFVTGWSTPDGCLGRELYQNPCDSGLGSIVICLDLISFVDFGWCQLEDDKICSKKSESCSDHSLTLNIQISSTWVVCRDQLRSVCVYKYLYSWEPVIRRPWIGMWNLIYANV